MLTDGTCQLGLGVASAGGYYYLSRTSPETIKKAENAVEKATGVPLATNASAGAGGAVTSSDISKSALDPSKFVNFKLKEVKVRICPCIFETTCQLIKRQMSAAVQPQRERILL